MPGAKAGTSGKPTSWSLAFERGAAFDKTEFPDFPKVVYWIRQVMAIAIGLLAGAVPVTGIAGIIGFFAGSTALLFAYITRFLDLDEEEFPRNELLQEGLSSAFGLFMAVWIVTYTALHGETTA